MRRITVVVDIWYLITSFVPYSSVKDKSHMEISLDSDSHVPPSSSRNSSSARTGNARGVEAWTRIARYKLFLRHWHYRMPLRSKRAFEDIVVTCVAIHNFLWKAVANDTFFEQFENEMVLRWNFKRRWSRTTYAWGEKRDKIKGIRTSFYD